MVLLVNGEVEDVEGELWKTRITSATMDFLRSLLEHAYLRKLLVGARVVVLDDGVHLVSVGVIVNRITFPVAQVVEFVRVDYGEYLEDVVLSEVQPERCDDEVERLGVVTERDVVVCKEELEQCWYCGLQMVRKTTTLTM